MFLWYTSYNRNTLWHDALEKEIYNVSVASEILDYKERAPVGWTKISSHLLWNLKMNLTRKARWVKDGHRIPDSKGSNYAGLVSRDSICIALTYVSINELEVMALDVGNAYL